MINNTGVHVHPGGRGWPEPSSRRNEEEGCKAECVRGWLSGLGAGLDAQE